MPTACRAYTLRNPAGQLYTGASEDVPTRLAQHNTGKSKWTAKFRPWALAWTSEPLSLSEARKLENLLKKQKVGDGLYRITGLARALKSGS